VLTPSLLVSYSHTDADIDFTVAAIDGALAVYRRALDDGVERYLIGRPSQAVYRRYNQPENPLGCEAGASAGMALAR
jgi:glutamate-1-semialdehyde 2,1-aminomutase